MTPRLRTLALAGIVVLNLWAARKRQPSVCTWVGCPCGGEL